MASNSFIAIPGPVAADETITAADKLVYGAMLTYQGIHHHCFASRSTIAHRVGLSVSAVARAIPALHRKGYIEPVMVHSIRADTVVEFQQRGGKQGGKTKCWRCLVSLPRTARSIKGIQRVK